MNRANLRRPPAHSIQILTLKIAIDKVPRPCYNSAGVRFSISASSPGPRTSSSVVPPVSHGIQDFNDVPQFKIELPVFLASDEGCESRASRISGESRGLLPERHPAIPSVSIRVHPWFIPSALHEGFPLRHFSPPPSSSSSASSVPSVFNFRLFSAPATPYVFSIIQKSAYLVENKHF